MQPNLLKLACVCGLAASTALNALPAAAKEEFKVGIVTFLSGPAARAVRGSGPPGRRTGHRGHQRRCAACPL